MLFYCLAKNQICDFIFIAFFSCTVSQKLKGNTPPHFSTNYRREMKLVTINMDYSLLSFDNFKFSLGGRVHRVFVPNFNFSVNTQIG